MIPDPSHIPPGRIFPGQPSSLELIFLELIFLELIFPSAGALSAFPASSSLDLLFPGWLRVPIPEASELTRYQTISRIFPSVLKLHFRVTASPTTTGGRGSMLTVR